MYIIDCITLFFKKLFCLPKAIIFWIKDIFIYYKNKRYNEFFGWGLHLFVGKFGAGKTCTMIYKAYRLAKRYPQLTIVTNLKLKNFPAHTKILPLNSPQDILNAPQNSLILIDEIGTIFNSRDFAKSKESVPKILFQHLCQCRKRKMMIYGTVQRWCFLDKQLRDITDTVTVTKTDFRHPFGRLCACRVYDSVEYDRAYTNPMISLLPLSNFVYVQSDKLRNSYDTEELITNMLNKDYISDSEILENRGDFTSFFAIENSKTKGKKTKLV